jgi:hypothetical protein
MRIPRVQVLLYCAHAFAMCSCCVSCVKLSENCLYTLAHHRYRRRLQRLLDDTHWHDAGKSSLVLHSSANGNGMAVAQVQHGDEDDPEKGLSHYHANGNQHYNHVHSSGNQQHSNQQHQYHTSGAATSSSNSKKKPGSAAVTSIVRGVVRTLQLGGAASGTKGGSSHGYDCMQTYSLLPVKVLRRVSSVLCIHACFVDVN